MDRVDALAEEVETILTMEKEERAFGAAEMEVRKGENLVGFEDEIKSRPKRTWFATGREKDLAKERGRKELNGRIDAVAGPPPKSKSALTTHGKLSNKVKKSLDAKKEMRDGRMWKKGKGDSNAVGKVKTKGKTAGKPKAKMKAKVKVKEGRRGGSGNSTGGNHNDRGRRK